MKKVYNNFIINFLFFKNDKNDNMNVKKRQYERQKIHEYTMRFKNKKFMENYGNAMRIFVT